MLGRAVWSIAGLLRDNEARETTLLALGEGSRWEGVEHGPFRDATQRNLHPGTASEDKAHSPRAVVLTVNAEVPSRLSLQWWAWARRSGLLARRDGRYIRYCTCRL